MYVFKQPPNASAHLLSFPPLPSLTADMYILYVCLVACWERVYLWTASIAAPAQNARLMRLCWPCQCVCVCLCKSVFVYTYVCVCECGVI